uniref:Uncharacterized protein n=1 Tax=Human herpesvirus 2 TaxID=10310 RepID=A0A481TGC7_HHV2|nr:hypothetical protein [Human alphaherpesvirus 2]
MLMGFLEYTRLVPGDGAAPRGGGFPPSAPAGARGYWGNRKCRPFGGVDRRRV